MAACTTDLSLGAGSFVRNAETDENVSIAGMRTRGNSLKKLDAGADTVLTGDQHATNKADAMIYDLQIGAVSQLRFSGFTTFDLGEGNDVLDLTVKPANTASAWTTAVTANGGTGDDVIWTGNFSDILNGDAGLDRIWGGAGNDSINGGADADVLFGSSGFDLVNGDAGDDTLFGGNDNDTLNGGDGLDTLSGDDGNDSINGGAETDRLSGGADNDRLNGDAGDDVIIGGSDTGVLTNNIIRPGQTTYVAGDILRGGDGVDRFVWRSGDGADAIMDFTNDVDRLLVPGTATAAVNFAVTVDGVSLAARSGSVIAVDASRCILIAGLLQTQFQFLGTEVLDGVTYNVYN